MLFPPPDLSAICLWMLFAQWDISATYELAHDLSDVRRVPEYNHIGSTIISGRHPPLYCTLKPKEIPGMSLKVLSV